MKTCIILIGFVQEGPETLTDLMKTRIHKRDDIMVESSDSIAKTAASGKSRF